jgi:hypothetical protein
MTMYGGLNMRMNMTKLALMGRLVIHIYYVV